MARPRLLVLIGSGETTGTMVSTHRDVLARFGDHAPDARVVDTPYGFQENADDLSARATAYFDRQVGHGFAVTTIRAGDRTGSCALGQGLAQLDRADVVFAGPGSPSYLVEQWRGTAVPGVLRDKLRRGGVVVLASAAACTAGRFTVPVYEIYKVGEDPRWLPGFDLTGEVGLDVAVIPHFDNAEGGTHDTRYCYLGERRLRMLEAQLPHTTGVLGIDEHTAAVFDLDADTVEVTGRGRLTARRGATTTTWEAGEIIRIEELRTVLARSGPDAPAGEGGPPPGPSDIQDLRDAFDTALEAGDALAAARVAQELRRLGRPDDEPTSGADQALEVTIARLAQVAQDGLHDHRGVVAPFVDALLELRGRARGEGDFATADAIREQLIACGIEVRDTGDGPHWHYDERPR